VIKDLTITLAGECTDITACVYVNSYNKVGEANYDSNYPETIYAQNLTMYDVFMSGKYTFGSENGYPIVSDAYENYKGVGIYSHRLFFNYAHIDHVHFKHLHAGVYGGGGSNYFKVTSEFCRYGLYIVGSGDNTFFVDGHSYYATNANGDYISMSDEIAHVESGADSTYHLRSYDTQAYKHLVFLGSKTLNNKVDFYGLGHWHGLGDAHPWNILNWHYIDYGRNNVFDSYKKTPFRIGSRADTISRSPYLELSDPVIQNALSGAGVWGNITSNIEFNSIGIDLKDVCRYPAEKTVNGNELPRILSVVAPSEENPIEIVIDYSNRPVKGYPNYFIQFHSHNVASDYVVSFDTANTGEFDIDIPVSNNTNIVQFYNYPQIGHFHTTYRMRIRFTKALQIENLEDPLQNETFNYNPNGLIGICNIGMTVNDYAGRSFLGECGGSLYGNVDMHQNTLKNLPEPVEDGDAVSKAYLEQRSNAITIAEIDAICVIPSEEVVPLEAGLYQNGVMVMSWDELVSSKILGVGYFAEDDSGELWVHGTNGIPGLVGDLVISDEARMIHGSCFKDCIHLTGVTIPDSVSAIYQGAFQNCTNLTTVTIPQTITAISAVCFDGCISLTEIIFKGTVDQWNAMSFDNYWNQNVPATHVTCSDGTVTL
jgi:hypothetical protein